jgi:glucose/arabinose dehydrogenase
MRILQAGALIGWSIAFAFAGSAPAQPLSSEPIGAGFDAPMFATHAPGFPDLLFVAEREGIIRAVDLETGATLAPAFLDIDARVITTFERGLLGLAFHPGFAANGRFYVHYSNTDGDSQISEFIATLDPLEADPESERPILEVEQPQGNHNGGWIGFSPIDSMLYVAFGDGGGSDDSATGHTEGIGNAQDLTDNLLGKLLRLDVDGDDFADEARNYAIPPDNPFVEVTGDDEIWASGLRNPFRAGFDRATGDLWIGDVGQNNREEVDLQPADSPGGENYGWRLREGTIATPTGGVGGERPPGNVDPVFEYLRSPGMAITGGTVYRGTIAALHGRYVFGDFSSRIWSFDPADPFLTLLEHTTEFGSIPMPVAFGEDAAGELYVVSLAGGVHRIVPEPGSGAAGVAAVLALAARRRGTRPREGARRTAN